MFKKIFLVFVLFFILLILAIAFIGPRLINTSKIKNKITENIREKYSYEVEIDSVRISLFPGIKARLERIGAKSSAEDRYGFNVQAKALEASIKLIPLFYRKIEIGKILIDEPVIILKEKKAVAEKIVEANIPASAISETLPAKKQTAKVTSPKSSIEFISISGLVIRNGRIMVKSKTLLPERIREIELTDINLYAAPLVLNRPMQIKFQSKLKANTATGESLFLRPVEISLVEKIIIEEQAISIEKLNLNIEPISISLLGSFSNIEKPIIDARLSTEIDLGFLKDFVNFSSGQSMSGSVKFEGALAGPLDKYSVDNLRGALEMKETAFNGIIPNANLKINGKLDFASSSILKEALSGNLDKAQIKAKLLLSHGSFNKIAFQNLSSDLSYQNNIMDLSPIKFSLYGGTFNGVIRATGGDEPGFNFRAEVKDILVEKFLADTSAQKVTVYGKLNSQLEVSGKGKDPLMVSKTLKGNMHVEMRDGKITSLNFLRDVLSVAGLLTGMPRPEGDYTQVDVLTADVVIADEKAATDNLYLSSKSLEVVGKGHFSFDQRLHFIMDAYVGAPGEGHEEGGGFFGKYMRDKFGRLVIPIKVTGTVERPHVSLDTERLVKDFLQDEIKKLLPKLFKKKGN